MISCKNAVLTWGVVSLVGRPFIVLGLVVAIVTTADHGDEKWECSTTILHIFAGFLHFCEGRGA